jgi:hypothetical protein
MQEAPVFIISTGRSGSTLLQRLLNCHPGLVVWGEHHGFLGGLGYTFNRMFIEGDENPFPRGAQPNPGPALLLPTLADPAAEIEWANPWTAEEYAEQLRGFISGYFGRVPAGVRWGFKEIRYQAHGQYEMLRRLYPAGHFLFLRRNPMAVARSKTLAWGDQPAIDSLPFAERTAAIRERIAEVRGQYTTYEEFVTTFPDTGTLVDYETLVADPRLVMARLFERLALDPDAYDWSLADQVIGRRISTTIPASDPAPMV